MSEVSALLETTFQPGTRLAARSRWAASTPVSSTATVMPSPRVVSQAPGAWIFARCQALAYFGSVGTTTSGG